MENTELLSVKYKVLILTGGISQVIRVSWGGELSIEAWAGVRGRRDSR